MLRKWYCQADVTLIIKPVDPVLIKSGYATLDAADMVPVSTFKDGEQVYYFPGTSLKGVLRSHLERIARTLRPGSVCIPYLDPKKTMPVPVAEEKESYGCGYRSRASAGKDPAWMAYHDSCAACRLFGSLKFGGRLSIGDAYPLPNCKPAAELRNGVGIDRFTGGVVGGLLFDQIVLTGGKFATKIRLTNFELWQLASLNLLLADLQDELLTIGSGRSRGLGRVRGEVEGYRVTYLRSVSDLKGLYHLATEQEREEYLLHDWTPSPIALPPAQPKGLRQEYVLDADWQRQHATTLLPAFESFLQWHGGPKGHYANNSDSSP